MRSTNFRFGSAQSTCGSEVKARNGSHDCVRGALEEAGLDAAEIDDVEPAVAREIEQLLAGEIGVRGQGCYGFERAECGTCNGGAVAARDFVAAPRLRL